MTALPVVAIGLVLLLFTWLDERRRNRRTSVGSHYTRAHLQTRRGVLEPQATDRNALRGPSPESGWNRTPLDSGDITESEQRLLDGNR